MERTPRNLKDIIEAQVTQGLGYSRGKDPKHTEDSLNLQIHLGEMDRTTHGIDRYSLGEPINLLSAMRTMRDGALTYGLQEHIQFKDAEDVARAATLIQIGLQVILDQVMRRIQNQETYKQSGLSVYFSDTQPIKNSEWTKPYKLLDRFVYHGKVILDIH